MGLAIVVDVLQRHGSVVVLWRPRPGAELRMVGAPSWPEAEAVIKEALDALERSAP